MVGDGLELGKLVFLHVALAEVGVREGKACFVAELAVLVLEKVFELVLAAAVVPLALLPLRNHPHHSDIKILRLILRPIPNKVGHRRPVRIPLPEVLVVPLLGLELLLLRHSLRGGGRLRPGLRLGRRGLGVRDCDLQLWGVPVGEGRGLPVLLAILFHTILSSLPVGLRAVLRLFVRQPCGLLHPLQGGGHELVPLLEAGILLHHLLVLLLVLEVPELLLEGHVHNGQEDVQEHEVEHDHVGEEEEVGHYRVRVFQFVIVELADDHQEQIDQGLAVGLESCHISAKNYVTPSNESIQDHQQHKHEEDDVHHGVGQGPDENLHSRPVAHELLDTHEDQYGVDGGHADEAPQEQGGGCKVIGHLPVRAPPLRSPAIPRVPHRVLPEEEVARKILRHKIEPVRHRNARRRVRHQVDQVVQILDPEGDKREEEPLGAPADVLDQVDEGGEHVDQGEDQVDHEQHQVDLP
mmetsp:Transcript_89556/g.240135  ORF Transcript_89556/g.240135 Transcript_89556/m.240135 type:complete len:466 (-) Transcript_89556:125-1522(-)